MVRGGSQTDRGPLRLAKKLSSKSTCSKKLAAVIVSGHTVRAAGFNKRKTVHRLGPDQERVSTRHAEIDAISQCSAECLSGATIYIVRTRKDGSTGMAKPCPACEAALRAAGISMVVYTNDGHDVVSVQKYD